MLTRNPVAASVAVDFELLGASFARYLRGSSRSARTFETYLEALGSHGPPGGDAGRRRVAAQYALGEWTWQWWPGRCSPDVLAHGRRVRCSVG